MFNISSVPNDGLFLDPYFPPLHSTKCVEIDDIHFYKNKKKHDQPFPSAEEENVFLNSTLWKGQDNFNV